MIPEAVAFSVVAGVSPLVGLWTTVVLGFVPPTLGGRVGICSSPSGACSVVVAALCASHGPAYVSACAMLAGTLQVLAGCLGLDQFIRLVPPHPVMLGFVHGLAILVMTRRAEVVHIRSLAKSGSGFLSLLTAQGASKYGVMALVMALLFQLWPRVRKKLWALASVAEFPTTKRRPLFPLVPNSKSGVVLVHSKKQPTRTIQTRTATAATPTTSIRGPCVGMETLDQSSTRSTRIGNYQTSPTKKGRRRRRRK